MDASTMDSQPARVWLWLLLAALPLWGCAFSRTSERSVGQLPPNKASEYAHTRPESSSRPAPPTPQLPPAAAQLTAFPVRAKNAEEAAAPAPPRQLASAEPKYAGRYTPRGVEHANQRSFDQQVLRSDVPVLVDFYATWCGPCKRLAPTLEELATESPGARVVKIDIDDNPDLAARYGVNSVPSLMVFKGGQVTARQNGVASKTQLKSMLEL